MATIKKCTAIAVVSIVLLSSCTKEYIYPTEVVNVEIFSKDYVVKRWDKGDDDVSGMYWYCEFKEPKLTSYIYDNGTMQAFLLVNNDNMSPLPFNDYWIDGDDPNIMWTEQITCEFLPGVITFIVKSSDHANIPPHYKEYLFNVRFMW